MSVNEVVWDDECCIVTAFMGKKGEKRDEKNTLLLFTDTT